MKPLAIIGIDPGTTSAYAAIGLDGSIIRTNSRKEFSLAEMIAELIEVCLPVIVSTDKAKVPSFVQELARKVGAEIVSPPDDLLKEEKRALIGAGYRGDHEQDSMAAALFAYRKYFPRLDKIHHFIHAHGLESLREEFTRMALKENLNFSVIRDILTSPAQEDKVIKEVVQENRITRKDFLSLYRKLSSLKQERQALQHRLQQLQQEIVVVRKENRFLHRTSQDFHRKLDVLLQFKEERLRLQQKELQGQQRLIQQLNEKILSLYGFIEKMSQYQLVKKLPTLSRKEFEQRNNILNIDDNDVLWVENPHIYSERALQELQEKGILIVSPVKAGRAVRERCPVIHFSGGLAHENEYFGLLQKELLEEIKIPIAAELRGIFNLDRINLPSVAEQRGIEPSQEMKNKIKVEDVVKEYREGRRWQNRKP